MRILVVTALPVLLIAANEPAEVPVDVRALNNPNYNTPPQAWRTLEEAVASVELSGEQPAPAECNDRITQAREATGQTPLLQREPASPEKPLAIYAVDRRQDGCSVMVMMGDPDDIRPLPLPANGPLLQAIPARGGQ